MNTPLRVSNQIRAEREEQGLGIAFRSRRVARVLGLCVIAFLVLALLGLALVRRQIGIGEGQARVTTLENQVSVLQAEVRALRTRQPAEPACNGYTQQLSDLTELLKRGRFALAAEMANLHVENRQNPPCPEARVSLAALGYVATMNDILTSPVGDRGHMAMLRWLEAERRATANGVPEAQRMSLTTIVVQASNMGAWELAHAAFLKAWESGLADAYDLSSVNQYYTIVRNLGRSLALKGSPEEREKGVRLLATAHALAIALDLSDREACADLRALGHIDCSQPSPDLLDPVLAVVRKQT